MNPLRIVYSSLAVGALTVAAIAADPTGTWQWTTQSPAGPIDTTLKLQTKDGKLAGAYSNQFGEAMISKASLKDDVIAFEVVRDLGGNPYVVKYHGKVDGDTIKGTLEAPTPDGGEPLKLEWNAKRTSKPGGGK